MFVLFDVTDILLSKIDIVSSSIPTSSIMLSICNDFVNIVAVPLTIADTILFTLTEHLRATFSAHRWLIEVLQLVSILTAFP
jgi:hypothetical protein